MSPNTEQSMGQPVGTQAQQHVTSGKETLVFCGGESAGNERAAGRPPQGSRALGSCTTSSRCPGVHRQRAGKIPGPTHRSLTGAPQRPAPLGQPSLLSPWPAGSGTGPRGAPTSANVPSTSGCLLKAGQTQACVAFPVSFQLVLIMCLNVQRELFLRWCADRSRLRSLPANLGLLRSPPSASARARSKVHVLHFYAVPER